MIRRKLFLIPFLQLVWLTIASIQASAEWFADLYVGPAITQNEDVRFKLLPPFSPKFTLNNMSFDTSVSFGGRFGHWFESFPYLGLGLDVFHFSPDLSSQRVHVCGPVGCFTDPNIHFDLAATSISFDAMLRWPLLTSKDFPKGQLQPYLTIGPAIFIARGKDLVATGGPATRSDTDISVGAKTGADSPGKSTPTSHFSGSIGSRTLILTLALVMSSFQALRTRWRLKLTPITCSSGSLYASNTVGLVTSNS